jgi:hypothetical protein
MEDADAGTEALVLVSKLREKVPEAERLKIGRELRGRMAQTLAVTLSDVRLVGPDWALKTGSGNLTRSTNHEKHLRELFPRGRKPAGPGAPEAGKPPSPPASMPNRSGRRPQ